MPLSEEELRMLEQMERALSEEDPKFVSTLRGTSFQRAARRRAIIAGVVFVLGMAMLTGGVILGQPILGVAGFIVMLGAAVVAVTAMRNPAMTASLGHPAGGSSPRETRHQGFGVVDGGRPGRAGRGRRERHERHGSFMQRLEQRWQHRRDNGPF